MGRPAGWTAAGDPPSGRGAAGRRPAGQQHRRPAHAHALYRAQAEGAQPLGTDFRQVPPVFTVLDGQGAQQPLAILTQSWRLDHPDHLLLVESPGAFQPKADLDQDGSLGQWSSLLRAPSPKQIRDSLFLVSFLFLAVWGVRKTVERFGWRRALSGSAVCLFAALVLWVIMPMGPGGRVAVDFDTAAIAPTAAPVGVVADQQADFSPLKPFGAVDPANGMTTGGMGGGGGGFGGAMPGMALPPEAPMSEAAPAPAAEPAPAAAEFAPAKEDLAKSIDESVAMDALKAEEKSKDRFAVVAARNCKWTKAEWNRS